MSMLAMVDDSLVFIGTEHNGRALVELMNRSIYEVLCGENFRL